MNEPLISIVMPVFNEKRTYLIDAAKSILFQSYKNIEFIIVNDGSTNIETINALNYLKNLDSRIKLINQENLGLTFALNNGFKNSNGEFIARQDSDDISSPFRLELQYDFLKKNKNIELLGTNAYAINSINSIQYLFKMPEKYKSILHFSRFSNPFIHGSIILRANLMKKVGYYTEQYKHAEDFDFFSRISQNFQTANLPYFLYAYRLNEVGVSSSNKKYQKKSKKLIIKFFWRKNRNNSHGFKEKKNKKRLLKWLLDKFFYLKSLILFVKLNLNSFLKFNKYCFWLQKKLPRYFFQEYKANLLMILPGKGINNCMIHSRRLSNTLESDFNVKYIYLGKYNSMLKKISEIIISSKKTQPDLIISGYGTYTLFISTISNLLSKKPLLVHFRGSDLNGSVDVPFYINFLRKFVSVLFAFKASTLVFVSKNLVKKSIKFLFPFKNKYIVPDPTDFEIFNINLTNSDIYKEYILENKKNIFFYASKSPEVKGKSIVDRVYNILETKFPGKYNIVYISSQLSPGDLANLIRRCDFCIHPSLLEGSPNIVRESICCNTPVIASQSGDLNEISKNCDGLHIVKRDPYAFSEKILSLSNSTKKSIDNSYIKENYSFKVVRNKMFLIISKILSK